MSKYTLEVIVENDVTDQPNVFWDSFDGYQDALNEALYYAEEWDDCIQTTVIHTGTINAKDIITFNGKRSG